MQGNIYPDSCCSNPRTGTDTLTLLVTSMGSRQRRSSSSLSTTSDMLPRNASCAADLARSSPSCRLTRLGSSMPGELSASAASP